MTANAHPQLNAALSGRYTIERELGSGGMATVYLAHDVRHHRKVALKVLRPELSAILGAERFLAEIKTTANLQHPHILSLFDSGEADGTVFYVMPYVEGETLRDRIKRDQQLPVDEAVRIAREVLDALEYAHQHGVVHRDIKPENILLHGGHAMVADFGIALAASKVEGGTRMTETGMSLGTPHYMSPEQAMGERIITPKADIYALGCVLYEMLTGEPPFTGASAQAVFARVLTDEPRSLTLQRKTIPPHVADAVHVALEKLPADRFASAAEFAAGLTEPGPGRVGSATAAATRRSRANTPQRPWKMLGSSALAGLVVGAIAAAAWTRTSPSEQRPLREIKFSLALPDSARYSDTFGRSIAVSPDGGTIVYPGGAAGNRHLFVRRLDEPQPVRISGSEGGYMPFFSPDGDWLGFAANQRLMKVRLSGGTPISIAQLFGNTMQGATWNAAGVIVLEDVSGLSRVSAAGGRLTQLTRIDSMNLTHTWPSFLPTGDAVLFSVTRSTGNFIAVATVADGRVTVFEDVEGSDPRFVAPGFVMWTSSDGVLFAAPFDVRSRRFTAPPTPLQEGVVVDAEAAKIAIGPGVAVRVEGGSRRARLLRLDRRGVARPERPEELNYSQPRFSPDGRRIAVLLGNAGGTDGELWVLDRVRGTRQRLSLERPVNSPEWSPDGKRLLVGYIPGVSWDVFTMAADGSGSAVPLVASAETEFPAAWSPDGKVVFARQTRNRGDIFYIDSAGGAVHEFATTPANEIAPALSPDGKWLAYVSDHSATREVFVRPFPTGEGRWQISTEGGVEPRWSKHGREIIYRDGEAFLAVQISAGPGLNIGSVDTLFRAPFGTTMGRAAYDVTRDGSEFIIVGGIADDRTLTVTINPFAELFSNGGRRAKR